MNFPQLPLAPEGPAPLAHARPSGLRQHRKIETTIAALLCGMSTKQAAAHSGIGYRTIKTWLASEWFNAEYASAKQQLLDSTVNQLRSAGGEAVEVLRSVMANLETPAAARVSAARSILELLLRAAEIQEVLTRLEKLEAATEGGLG